MKLTAFRIRNFRSIKDTGWQELAYDNITCLIGQNESGKTSILEGLRAFHDGLLIEDMLRSDLSLPQVSCRYRFDLNKLEKNIDRNRIHPEILEKFEKLEYISICREWESDLSSFLIAGEELNEIFQTKEEETKLREEKINAFLDKIDNEFKKAQLAVEKAQKELDETRDRYETRIIEGNELRKNSRSFFPKSKKNGANPEIQQVNKDIELLKSELKKMEEVLHEKKIKLAEIKESQQLFDRIRKSREDIQKHQTGLADARENLLQLTTHMDFEATEKEIRAAKATEEQYRLEIELARDELGESNKKYEVLLRAVELVLDGSTMDNAIKDAEAEARMYESYYTREQLGEELFRFSPEFELFEDFSSLLPNRIDLEDIVSGNLAAEGFKAAKNFLTITGLDASFFQQPSSRILKQKIENLNGEMTLNFQDFWRQNVGKKNKIKINFELAHYDHSHGEKSGKPFIEFWIKDDAERLYPKQRSRGVRWFLSFFLELKATAMEKGRQNKLLLIDEPGVSLHARAQEDVLKVFDDIRDKMQIIYSTHSPHLIDVNKLYRVIAVQRAVEDDMNSETIVLNARSLKTATADTLSPVYAMMGTRLNQQDIIKAYNNVIVKDLSTHYFLKAILLLTGYNKKECYFIPASGTSSIPMIVNILIGWGLEYIALNFGNEEEKFMYNKLRKELFDNNVDLANSQLLFMRDFPDVEDMFSTIDFKKHIVHVREGITTANSEYLKDNNHSRAVLASNFLQSVNRGELTLDDLDDESRDNLNQFITRLSKLLK